ncbi:MAG: DNA double-strand break repair nuclease NurA [Natronomonas sp.]
MTLDPVHFDGIAQLAGRIDSHVDETDDVSFADTVFREYLDPLWNDDERVLEPMDSLRKRRIDVESAALQDPPFPTHHGLDSGTINPTTFTNGLVLDVAQAAMAAVPSDLDLHRARSVVATVHSNDATVDCNENDWTMFDDGYSRGRIIQAPRVSRYEEAVVHALSLYLAEVTHARMQADVVSDLLVLDGPIYPKGLLAWADRHPELADLLVEDKRPREVVEGYLRLVETFAEREVPMVGFVKNTASKVITRTLRSKTRVPWVDDAAFFRQVLLRQEADERVTDELAFTNWFRSRGGVDRPLSTIGDALGIDRDRDLVDYEVTFCCIYDPRDDLVYRIEAPAIFTDSAEMRHDLTMQLVRAVAAERGPPLGVGKADELARISREEKSALSRKIETTFDADRDRTYDDRRWGVVAGAGD